MTQHLGPVCGNRISMVRKMLNNATGRSKKKGWLVGLTEQGILDVLRGQGYRCALSGLPFDLQWRAGKTISRNPFAPSLDRIDQGQGYSAENCRIILSALNYGINEWGLDVYLKIAGATLSRRRLFEQTETKNAKPDAKLSIVE